MTAAPVPAAASEPARPLRLPHLDGIRGLAALFVAAHHAFLAVGDDRPRWLHLTDPLHYGHLAVTVFIVLSGFCLMLPVARAGAAEPAGGTMTFFRRRARRIAPTFYASCGLSVVMLAVIGWARDDFSGLRQATRPKVLATHLLLAHNAFPDTIAALNGAFWSIATEWQIYFLFPLLLLPVWRRWGVLPLLAVGHALGFGLDWATGGRFALSCPWYVGMFASGMAAAAVAHGPGRTATWLRRHVPWGLAALALWAAVTWICRDRFWALGQFPLLDTLVGFGTAAFLVHSSTAAATEPAGRQSVPGWPLRLFGSRPLVWVGLRSYSLYLTHGWFTSLAAEAAVSRGWPPTAKLAFALSVGVPTAVVFAAVFYWAVERQFLGRAADPVAGGPAPVQGYPTRDAAATAA